MKLHSSRAIEVSRWLGGLVLVVSGFFVSLDCRAQASVSPSYLVVAPAPATAAALFKLLAGVESLQATFVEHKKLALLRAPLKSTGKLYYLRPGVIVRKLQTPEPSVVQIAPGVLWLEDARGRRLIQLKGAPGLQAFVESFSRVLQGDKKALEEHYRLKYNVAADRQWVLSLFPLTKPLNQLIRTIEVQGQGQRVLRLVTVEAKGDRTETVLSNVVVNQAFSPKQQRQLFGWLKESKTASSP